MRLFAPNELRHVRWLWDDHDAGALAGVERLAYRSRLLAADRRITSAFAGSSSSKLEELDPLTGDPVVVLWVDGRDCDPRAGGTERFASLVHSRVLRLCELHEQSAPRGGAAHAERELAARYPHCTYGGNPRQPSADAPLHALLEAKHVDHTCPVGVQALASGKHGKELTEQVFSGELGWLPWTAPGLERGLALRRIRRENPKLSGVVLAHQGVVAWADDDKECYTRSLSIAEAAARFVAEADRDEETFGGRRFDPLPESRRHAVLADVVPWLRARVGAPPMVATVHDDAPMLAFTDSRDAARLAALGFSLPDRRGARSRPLRIEWDPETEGTESLREKLAEALAGSPDPGAVLIPGLGLVAFGRDKSESRVTAEAYCSAVEAMRGAEAIDAYVAPPEPMATGSEHAAREKAVASAAPHGPELSGRIALVVGAGSGIGRATALRLAREGAHVVCADLDLDSARATAAAIEGASSAVLGDAGTGDSACGHALAAGVDVTRRESVKALVDRAVLAYGGLDHLVVTAGIYVAPDDHGRIADDKWRQTFEVNVHGTWLVVDECRRVFAAQGTPASVVITTSVNAVVAKKGSLAYDTSKAAANHLVRELAVELAPHVRVNAVAPATVIAGSTMFPRERVIASLHKYGIAFDPRSETDALRELLARFYAERTLTKKSVLPEDQAEAILFLLSDKSSKTTGQVLAVDGGLADAFPR